MKKMKTLMVIMLMMMRERKKSKKVIVLQHFGPFRIMFWDLVYTYILNFTFDFDACHSNSEWNCSLNQPVLSYEIYEALIHSWNQPVLINIKFLAQVNNRHLDEAEITPE